MLRKAQQSTLANWEVRNQRTSARPPKHLQPRQPPFPHLSPTPPLSPNRVEGEELTPVHLITWLARILTDAGAKPGSVSGEAFKALQARIGSETIDPVVAGYWDGWTQRASFQKIGVH